MDSIITEKLYTQQTISNKSDSFFKAYGISQLLSKSNFYKGGGIACITILKEIFNMVFTGKNLYRTLLMKPEELSFKKNAIYRFLNNARYNWGRLLLLLASRVIIQINHKN